MLLGAAIGIVLCGKNQQNRFIQLRQEFLAYWELHKTFKSFPKRLHTGEHTANVPLELLQPEAEAQGIFGAVHLRQG